MNFNAISKSVKILQIGPVEPKLWKIHQIVMGGNETRLFEIDLDDLSWGLVGSRGQILIQKCLSFPFHMVNKPPVTPQETFDLK